MGKNKVLVKVQPEGKYSTSTRPSYVYLTNANLSR